MESGSRLIDSQGLRLLLIHPLFLAGKIVSGSYFKTIPKALAITI
jgi:hypothetical protein